MVRFYREIYLVTHILLQYYYYYYYYYYYIHNYIRTKLGEQAKASFIIIFLL